MTTNMTDHDYNLNALRKACEDSDIEDIEVDESSSKKSKINPTHTPIKSPNPKKMTEKDNSEIDAAILPAVQALTGKVDEQTELLKKLDKRIEANTTATRENKQEIILLKKKIDELKIENSTLKTATVEPETDRSTRKGWRKHKRNRHRDSHQSCASICGPATRHHGHSPPPG